MSEQDYQKSRFFKLCYEGCQASDIAEKQRLIQQIEELEKNVALRKQELEAVQQSVLTDREQRNKFRDRISKPYAS